MTGSVFGLVFASGTALLALWLDVRFEARRPGSPLRRLGHAIAACIVLQVTTAAFGRLGAPDAMLGERMLALFALLMPSLVYAFLTGLWVLRTLTDAARLARR